MASQTSRTRVAPVASGGDGAEGEVVLPDAEARGDAALGRRAVEIPRGVCGVRVAEILAVGEDGADGARVDVVGGARAELSRERSRAGRRLVGRHLLSASAAPTGAAG